MQNIVLANSLEIYKSLLFGDSEKWVCLTHKNILEDEMEKMIKCKACDKEIAKSAKVCPHCGKKQKKKGVGLIAIVLITIGVIWAISDGASASGNSSGSSETVYNIGETISTDKVELTITSAKKLNKVGSEYFESTPSEGGIYVAVDYKYKNISKEPLSMCDQPTVNLLSPESTKYSQDIAASGYYATEKELNEKVMSDLSPGLTVKSAAVFEVAKEEITKEGWMIDIDGDKVVLKF